MKKRLITIGTAFILMIASTPVNIASPTNAETHKLKIPRSDEVMFDKLSNQLGQETNAYYNFFDAWHDNDSETVGLKFFEDYRDSVDSTGEFEINAFTQEYIDSAKNFIYFYFTFSNFLGVYSSTVDEARCLLDHFFPLKDDLVWTIENASNSALLPKTDEAKVFFETAFTLYDGLIETTKDTFVYDDVTLDAVFADYKEYMEDYLYGEEMTFQNSLLSKQLDLVIQISKYTELENNDFMAKALGSYNDSSKIGQYGFDYNTVIGFDEDDAIAIEGLGGVDEAKEYYEQSFNAFLFAQEVFNYIVFYSPEDLYFTSLIFNNFGPMAYKILDLVEAYRDEDYINIMILSSQVVYDALALKDLFENEILTLGNNGVYICEAVNTILTSKEEEIASIIASEIDDNLQFSNHIDTLNYIRGYLDSLKDKMEKLYESIIDENVNAIITRIDLNIKIIDAFIIKINDTYLSTKILEYESIYTTLSAQYDGVEAAYEFDYLNAEKYKEAVTEILTFLALIEGGVQEDADFFGSSSVFVSIAADIDELCDKCDSLFIKIDDNYKVKKANADIAEFETKYNDLNSKFQIIKSAYKFDLENIDNYSNKLNGILDEINNFKEELLAFISEAGSFAKIDEINLNLTVMRTESSDMIDEIQSIKKNAEIQKATNAFNNLVNKIENLLNNEDAFSYNGFINECEGIDSEIDSTIALIDEKIGKVGNDSMLLEYRDKLSEQKAAIADKKDEIAGTHKRNIALIIVGALLFVLLVLTLLYFFGFKKRFLRKENKVKES